MSGLSSQSSAGFDEELLKRSSCLPVAAPLTVCCLFSYACAIVLELVFSIKVDLHLRSNIICFFNLLSDLLCNVGLQIFVLAQLKE